MTDKEIHNTLILIVAAKGTESIKLLAEALKEYSYECGEDNGAEMRFIAEELHEFHHDYD
jgi:hypothetical protein